MRFFKHGDVLAISLPESLRKKLNIAENDEYEFCELPNGQLGLAKKSPFKPNPASAMEKINRPLAEIKNPSSAGAKPTSAVLNGPSKNASSIPKAPTVSDFYSAALDKSGFLVLLNEDEAKNVSHRYESQIKAGDIKGIRGFDKKFYIATRAYTDAYADKLLVALKEPKTAPQLAVLLKQPEDGIITLLYLLKEEGEIIEKKRGLFARVL